MDRVFGRDDRLSTLFKTPISEPSEVSQLADKIDGVFKDLYRKKHFRTLRREICLAFSQEVPVMAYPLAVSLLCENLGKTAVLLANFVYTEQEAAKVAATIDTISRSIFEEQNVAQRGFYFDALARALGEISSLTNLNSFDESKALISSLFEFYGEKMEKETF
ncbi:MAG: hypothetical protein MRY21_01725 [Simkaniaceae bacterium]|nr:hypothetical protein [Simkaniaceae bacterium]